jgi:hypothetical protein
MIIKGSSRGRTNQDVKLLADHLLDAGNNESIHLIELRHVASENLHDALTEFKTLSLGTRTRNCIYHASINLSIDETTDFTDEQWLRSVDELESRLGFEGHQRAIVRHCKHGREHIHVVWNRIHPETLKTTSDSHNYRKHEETSRYLEGLFSLKSVIGVHTREQGTSRPVAIATHKDWQISERTKIDVKTVAKFLQKAWLESDCGMSFSHAVSQSGLNLCVGKRGFIIVDRAGTPHSLPRRLSIKAHLVKAKLADLDPANFPTVEEQQTQIINIQKRIKKMKDKKPQTFSAKNGSEIQIKQDLQEVLEYWKQQGVEPYIHQQAVWFMYLDCLWQDNGDSITIHSEGEPTDAQISALVKAGKDKGWQSIHFFGGSKEFQHRARAEALKQGYPVEKISLECEDDSQRQVEATLPKDMPDYLREAISKTSAPDEPIEDNNFNQSPRI